MALIELCQELSAWINKTVKVEDITPIARAYNLNVLLNSIGDGCEVLTTPKVQYSDLTLDPTASTIYLEYDDFGLAVAHNFKIVEREHQLKLYVIPLYVTHDWSVYTFMDMLTETYVRYTAESKLKHLLELCRNSSDKAFYRN